MSAEYAAERIADLIHDNLTELVDDPMEDARSGGYFFDVTLKGKTYEVLVQKVTR